MSSDDRPSADAMMREMAIAILSEAVRAQAVHDHSLANDRLDRALLMIGDSYQSPQTIDESSQKLVLARIEAQRGRLAVAVTLKRRAVEARLEMLQQQKLAC